MDIPIDLVDPGAEITIDELRTIVETNFPNRWRETEACLSVIATLLLEDIVNPTGLNLIGPPAAEKTTVLSFFYGLNEITYKTDQFTPKAFVTHSAQVKAENLAKIDLLPRIKAKCMIVPELAPIFGKRKEDLLENISILTRVFDGEGYSSDSGARGRRGYEGDYMFSWLGASTPLEGNVWRVMGKLGSRWLFLNMPEGNTKKQELKENITSGVTYKNKRDICRNAVCRFLKQLWHKKGGFRGVAWDNSNESDEVIDKIASIAQILVRLRGTLTVYQERGYNREEEYNYRIPIIEKPHRAMSILYNLVRGRAIIYGRTQTDASDIPMIKEIAFSSMPDDRRKAFQALIRQGGRLSTRGVIDELNCSKHTALKIMETIKILKIVVIGKDATRGGYQDVMTILPEFVWAVKESVNNMDDVLKGRKESVQHSDSAL